MNDLQFDPVRLSVRRDLLIVAVVAIATFWVASATELSEHLIALTKPFEAYQFDELPSALVAMMVALAWFSWRRARQAIEQVNLRLLAQQQLAEALGENRRLSQRYLKVQEEERRFLARELHDELGQSLNAIKVDAVNIRDAAAGNSPEVVRGAQAIIDVSSKVYDVVRTLLRQLRPVALDELGLASAVQFSVDEWKRRHREVECVLSIDDDLEGFSEEVNISVYRFVQECLTNIAKHANASKVTIALHRRKNVDGHTRLEITVEDDGRGLDTGAPANGLGLIGLRERIEALGGEFEIEAAAEAGTGSAGTTPAAREGGQTGFTNRGTCVVATIPIGTDNRSKGT